MSCDHLYVTEADKALEMCGLCGVTFGEWHDGNVSTYRDGVMAERERIIKLLGDKRFICFGDTDCYESLDGGCRCASLIALIKGETIE